VRINNLGDSKFIILIIKFLRGPVHFNVLKIKLYLIPNIEANR
jgi:hypothetical protein